LGNILHTTKHGFWMDAHCSSAQKLAKFFSFYNFDSEFKKFRLAPYGNFESLYLLSIIELITN